MLGFPRYIGRISAADLTGGVRGLASEVRLEGRVATPPVVGDSLSLAALEAPEARSQSETAYLRIRDRIVSLEMPPGSVVEESRLREELEIGRTPIREALQRLALENLVRSIPHRGTFVTDVNITDLARITEVRVVLESHAARLAAERIAAADQAVIQDLLRLLEAGGASDQRELMRLDQRIHRQIYRAARNPFWKTRSSDTSTSACGCWYLVVDQEVRLREAVVEHIQLLRAVLAGDGSKAEDEHAPPCDRLRARDPRVLVER